jgi:hypothetical protein
MVNFPVDFHPSFECPLQRRNNLTFNTNTSIYVIKQARFRWKQSVGVVFIFSSKTRVLVWCGLKQAENRPKTSYVSDLRLSLGENARFQKWAFSAFFQAENNPFINSGTGSRSGKCWIRFPIVFRHYILTKENHLRIPLDRSRKRRCPIPHTAHSVRTRPGYHRDCTRWTRPTFL